jgi:DeoR/GlpR family transcriptional regulator of sugar metabolism
LDEFYRRGASGYTLAPNAAEQLGLPVSLAGRRPVRGPKRSIGFVPHYPAHEWYRAMARAMEGRAADLGLEVRVSAPTAEIAREIRELRDLIAASATRRVAPGQTVLINAGPFAVALANALERADGVTIVTNSFDVMTRLSGRAGCKVIMTSGEYQAKDRCLVGPSLGALFETMRIDTVFLSVDGVSAQFGASMKDERLALAARRFLEASREVVVVADHSLVGVEANHRIAPPAALDELVTDSGTLPADRRACADAGLRVALADWEDAAQAPENFPELSQVDRAKSTKPQRRPRRNA